MDILAPFILGLVGSLHCIGMCGPIVLALPIGDSGKRRFLTGRFLFNAGRILTYSIIGGIFGMLGGKVIMAGFQQWLSLSLGVLIILYTAAPSKYRRTVEGSSLVYPIISKLKSGIGNLLKKNGFGSLFVTGMLNGFLPCGLVYVALAASITAGEFISGFLTMTFFGLGTTPLLFAVSTFSGFVTVKIRRKLTRLVPYFAILLGILFILRGLNLNIPFISPKLSGGMQSTMNVHCN